MSMFAKIMVVVNFVLAIAFLAAAGTLHGAAESWQGKHTVLKSQSDATIAAKDGQISAKTQELDQARSEARSLEGRAQAAEAVQKQQADSNGNLMREIQAKDAQITALTEANTNATNAVQAQTAENARLRTELATCDADRKSALERVATLEENLARANQRGDTAESALASAEMQNKAMTERLDATNTELTAYKKMYPPLPNVAMVPVSGVVQAASAKDDVFVVSVGAKDGVKIGYEFTVSRGASYVSTIVIDSVFPNHAAGHTKTGMKKMDVQAGDSVTTSL